MSTIYFLDNILKGQGIGQYVKENIFDEYSQIIFVCLVVLLILLVIILYKHTFSKFNKDTITKINYSDKLKLEPLPPCSKIPKDLQYRLCDYYIASSFNTPNLGNQQLDYVSSDMIAKALTSGARFIQLPICAYSVDQETYPVIAQSQHGKQHITSLNTISTRDALNTIRDFAFKYIDNRANKNFNSDTITVESYNKINYPLIIQLKLHTNNDYVLNILYQDIKDILGPYLVDSNTYRNYPIHLEKLCMLLNKIIIISTPGYETNKLSSIIVPTTNNLFQTLDSNKLSTSELTTETTEQYYKGLSMIKQRESYKFAGKLSTIITNILDSDTLTQTLNKSIINNTELTDKLTIFNMVGCTIIEPIDNIVTSDNYNPILPFTYGCQFVTMNYQTHDKYMDLYLKIFEKSSFVLKPSGLRLPIIESELQTKLDNYSLLSQRKKININPTFQYDTLEKLIVLRPVSNNTMILSPISDTKITMISTETNKPNIEHLFVIKPSPLTTQNDLVIISSALNPEQVITVPENFRELGKQSTVQLDMFDSNNISKLRYQSFYPEYGLTQGLQTVSLRLYNDLAELNERDNNKLNDTRKNDTLYLGMYARQLRLLPMTEDKTLLTFNYSVINSIETIKVYHIAFGTLKIYKSGIVSLNKDMEPENGTPLQVIIVRDTIYNKGNLSPFSRVVRIKSAVTNKYLSSRNNILSCDRDMSMLDDSTIFIISKNKATDNEYTIEDYNGYFITANPNGILNLKRDKPILSPEVKDSTGKIIKSARIGPSLGTNKYFKFIISYELK